MLGAAFMELVEGIHITIGAIDVLRNYKATVRGSCDRYFVMTSQEDTVDIVATPNLYR